MCRSEAQHSVFDALERELWVVETAVEGARANLHRINQDLAAGLVEQWMRVGRLARRILEQEQGEARVAVRRGPVCLNQIKEVGKCKNCRLPSIVRVGGTTAFLFCSSGGSRSSLY